MNVIAHLKRRTCLLGVALLIGCGSTNEVLKPNDWTSNVQIFEAELQDLQTALDIPGLAYVIVSEDGPIASAAFGLTQAPESTPFATSTPLRIASVTKSITAVIAMQLVEEGRLDLDALAQRYAPELAVPEEVLVRHLLDHTSEGAVGTEYVYSSSRYALLGKIIEAAAGADFDAVVRERVLDRAAMHPHPSPDPA